MKSRWVLTTKYRIDSTVEREKARLVVKGFTQVCGADYDETYSPVSSYVTLRIFLNIVAVRDLNLMQLDMKNAFLHSKLDRLLYMYQPDYFDDGTGWVCKLLKSLYGLKQSPLLWYRALNGVLLGAGWKKSQVDEALYFKAGDNGVTCWVLVYVDDLLAASSSPVMLKELKELLGGCLQAARDFAGRQVPQAGDRVRQASEEAVASPAGLRRQAAQALHRRGAGRSSLKDAGLGRCLHQADIRRRGGAGARGGGVPAEGWLAAVRGNVDKVRHRFCLQQAGSGLTVRRNQHWREVDRCLAYLADTRDTALEFGGGPELLELIGYMDADDMGDKQNWTNTGGYVFVYRGATVWSSSRIKCMTLSSTESEYVAATDAGKEGHRLRFLSEVH
ncbi:unnamed protein product, partial [Closterium sp. NIES-54]